jgi:thioesterase domain-containing protein
MLGTRLFSQVRQALQTQISLIRFFEIPTVEGQALAIAESQPGVATPSIVAIQPTGLRPPFYYVPAGRDLMGLLDLGRLLGPDQPFYALHPDELVREQGRYVVGEAAARYLREIRSIQPEGPYFIGAACSGSVVAVELARALLARGQEVGLLALIIPVVHEYKRYFHHTLGSYWQSLSPLPPQEKLSRILGTLGRLARTTQQRLRNKIAGNAAISHRLGGPHSEYAAVDVMAINRRSLRAYVHNTYPGHMTILVTRDMFSESRLFLNPWVVWSRVAKGGLEVHVVPGSHLTVLSHPHVEVVAETLRACLDKAMIAASSKQAPPRGA